MKNQLWLGVKDHYTQQGRSIWSHSEIVLNSKLSWSLASGTQESFRKKRTVLTTAPACCPAYDTEHWNLLHLAAQMWITSQLTGQEMRCERCSSWEESWFCFGWVTCRQWLKQPERCWRLSKDFLCGLCHLNEPQRIICRWAVCREQS